MSALLQKFRKLGFRLARPDILFWTMPFMMILLVVGTISQKDVGILKSQQEFFSSFFYFLGWIPLPGGMLLISVMFINLLAKFLFKSEWSRAKAGTILTHFGVLVLLLGGIFSYFTSREGYLTLHEGETSQMIEDYHQRMMVIRDGQGQVVFQLPFEQLSQGMTITVPQSSLTLTLDKLCYNCAISRRDEADQAGWTSPGKFMQLNPKADDPQDEMNMTGVEFTTSEGQKYLTFDKFPKPPQILAGGVTYTVTIEREKRSIPFSLTLNKFQRELHPGTDMAKAFQSMVTVHDGVTSWPALIEMNEPLRYRGYTLYQSSFDMSGEKPYTVLAVVENKGRLFPYLATLIIAAGLILHLVTRLRKGAN